MSVVEHTIIPTPNRCEWGPGKLQVGYNLDLSLVAVSDDSIAVDA